MDGRATLDPTMHKNSAKGGSPRFVGRVSIRLPFDGSGRFRIARRRPSQVLSQLRETVRKLLPTPTSHHNTTKVSLPPSLATSPYVFVRIGGTQEPLQRPYEGPFRVIEHGAKTFKLEKGKRTEIVLVDRLKPAHLDLEHPVPVAKPRRRGRPPRKKHENPVDLRRSSRIKTQASKVLGGVV